MGSVRYIPFTCLNLFAIFAKLFPRNGFILFMFRGVLLCLSNRRIQFVLYPSYKCRICPLSTIEIHELKSFKYDNTKKNTLKINQTKNNNNNKQQPLNSSLICIDKYQWISKWKNKAHLLDNVKEVQHLASQMFMKSYVSLI